MDFFFRFAFAQQHNDNDDLSTNFYHCEIADSDGLFFVLCSLIRAHLVADALFFCTLREDIPLIAVP